MDQDKIMDIAKSLGEAIKQSNEFILFDKARRTMLADTELKKKMDEFKVEKALYDVEKSRETPDDHILDIVNERVEQLYAEITETPVMKAYSKAEEDLNILMTAVNMTISSYISPEDMAANIASASNCSHDCAHCSGCEEK